MKSVSVLVFTIFIFRSNANALNNFSVDKSPRIIGGTNAEISEFPSLVSITNYGRHHCAGTLLNEYWILTAAHCYLPTNQSTIEYATTTLMGSGHLIAFPELFIQHELFDLGLIIYDIGLVKVKAPINTGLHNSYAKLAMPGNYYATGTPSVSAGWGIWDNNNVSHTPPLQKADLDIWSYSDCKFAHKENPFNLSIHPHQICAGVGNFSKAECNG